LKVALETALVLVKKGHISISEAARVAAKRHDLEPSKIEPLRCRINYRLRATPKQQRSLLLSEEQETFLCDVIKAFSTRANPLASGDVRVLARSILALTADLVFNIDETRALPASRLQSLMAAKVLKETHYQQAMDETLYTLVSCIAADGSTLFCLYLFRLVSNKDELHQSVFVPQLVQNNTLAQIIAILSMLQSPPRDT
jgi:hypothetical protein